MKGSPWGAWGGPAARLLPHLRRRYTSAVQSRRQRREAAEDSRTGGQAGLVKVIQLKWLPFLINKLFGEAQHKKQPAFPLTLRHLLLG